MDWRTGGAANMNFYRPGYGYWPTANQVPPPPAALTPSNTGNNYPGQFSEQLNLSPYTSNPSAQQLSGLNSYGLPGPSQQLSSITSNSNNLNDGWSLPYVSPYNRPATIQQPYGDSYSVMPGTSNQPAKQQLDSNNSSYGTKGASGNKQPQQYGTTKK